MVAALEDFVAQTTAQVGFALEEGAGELEMWGKKRVHLKKTKQNVAYFEYYVCTEGAAPFVQRA